MADKDNEFLDDIMADVNSGPEDEMTLEDLANEEVDENVVDLHAQIAELKDAYMRALADVENSRKRSDRDRREAENYGGSRLARDLLPVYDNLERALQMAKEDGKEGDKALLEGVELTMRALIGVFKKHGIDPIVAEVGERFDPKIHEAMFEAPLPGTQAGDIIQVSGTGFMLHDRLLRAAQVGVSSTPKS
ncbi:MAG: nucleotide exchange factor GrpE [Octadecabacter sp.]